MENNRKMETKNNRNNNNNTRNANNQGMQGRKRTGSNSKLDNKDNHKKVGINARNDKAKYSDDEIARARYTDSKAKFLVRDRIHNDNIDTKNKWIDVTNLEVKDRWDRKGNYDPEILSFDAEIYDRTEQPVYEEGMTDDEKHQLTYEVAEGDIAKQQRQEARQHKKVDRPNYHVEVATKHTKDQKTEYQVKNIKKKR